MLNHPLFYPRIFALIAKKNRIEREELGEISLKIIAEEYDELSRRLDRSQIQESTAVRNILRTRHLANLLVNEKGEILVGIIPSLIEQLKSHLYSLGPNRQYDAKRQEHILVVLQQLLNNKEIIPLLKKIDRPLSNKLAEDLIRQTLQLPSNIAITEAHAKRAVLSAWLCLLRQNVGSCFATAPAEIVQTEQPELFLKDMLELLTFCRLKRTFGGVEYSVPLSDTWGSGDLKKPLLIKISNQGITPEIWSSPGLIAAFEAIELLAKNGSVKEKSQRLQQWIEPIIRQKRYYDSFGFVTAEELIKAILMQTLGITENQLREYENRPREMIPAELLITPTANNKQSGRIGDKYAHFISLFNIAKTAFKALADNPLLKAWEFTLASFSETKLEFTSWNLYASLGMSTQEENGIGQCIQRTIQTKLDNINREIQDLQYECEAAYTQVQTLESRLRHISTEKEAQWTKMEYQNRRNEYYYLQEQRDIAQRRAQALVNLYEVLYQSYSELFKEYFQEVYDADMQEVKTNPFDDSPAGFRLLYKHGRSNPSQWTRLRGLNDFVEALAAFFVATEPQLASLFEKDQERDLSQVVSNIITHVKTKEFQESAFYRMAAAHRVPLVQDPLNNLEHIEKKPWAYLSGGTMNTLVSCYYGLSQKPKEEEKWVENEMELLVFIADTLKQIPNHSLDAYLKGKHFSMLMQSPTHAFLLQPAISPFKECWQNEEFTYTFIRDRFVKPAEIFISELLLNDEMIYHLIQTLIEKVPENYQPRFKSVFGMLKGPLTPISFRETLVDSLEHDRGLRYGKRPVLAIDEIDSTLFSCLPFFPVYQLETRLTRLLDLLPGLNKEKKKDILSYLEHIPLSRTSSMMSAQQLQEACKALICLREMATSSPYDYHLHIAIAARQLGYALPTPVIFADTNWVKDQFGFVVNPGTGKLELWRLDYTATVGYPMSTWKEWVNGSRPDLKWGIYIKPSEYGQVYTISRK